MNVFLFKLLLGALHLLGTAAPLTSINALFYALRDTDSTSKSVGHPSSGELKNGRRLPTRGENFTSYSELGSLLGRTHVHGAVHDTMLDAYAKLADTHPDHHFVYAETGWPHGGAFAPHHTHQNGLSVDFVVPILEDDEEDGSASRPAALYCAIWNGWCYGLSFDAKGRRGTQRIDFEALGAHLLALDEAARAHGTRVERVILAPDLRKELFKTKPGKKVEASLDFLPGKAWVRHDDHYHVDFAAPR